MSDKQIRDRDCNATVDN